MSAIEKLVPELDRAITSKDMDAIRAIYDRDATDQPKQALSK